MDPSISNTNPTSAFISTPFFMGNFNHTIQQPRPPPCYLRPKKLCQNCLDIKNRSSASTDPRSKEAPEALASSSDSIAGGRSHYHSPGCKLAYPSNSSPLGNVLPMQPTLNSLNQLSWNFTGGKAPGKKMSDPGTCPHFSHYRSPTHRASVHSFPSSTDASTSKSSGSLNGSSRRGEASLSSQGPSSVNSNGSYAPIRRFPQLASKYFDNKYYEIHSTQVS